MATFANASFNAVNYASFRPNYPLSLYKYILKHHLGGIKGNPQRENKLQTALDLGCGTGQVTKVLPKLGFGTVIGIDPSAKMIDKATADIQNNPIDGKDFRYIISKAEEVDNAIPPQSVDLITAGQAVHWCNFDRLWPSLSRVLKPGGTVTFWGYAEFRLPSDLSLTPAIMDYSKGIDKLGPYWEQPGRDILDDHLRAVPFPTSPEWDLASAKRVYFCGEHLPELDLPSYEMQVTETDVIDEEQLEMIDIPKQPEYKTNIVLRKNMTWEGIDAYLRTWSSLLSYHEKHPEDKARKGQGRDGDILERFVWSLRDQIGGETTVVEWPMSLMMIKKSE